MASPLDPIESLRAALRGHYDFEREIGQGAFATVYLAQDLKHERKVAVKVLQADPNSETSELRFIREIRMLARLQHPNILPLHDSGHVEALLYYVMPYVHGETLRDRIDRERQLDVESACNIARDIADALAYAHAQGIVHRDIKPENILMSAGHPILADFGIARAIDLAGVRQLTRTGMGSPGTPAYMSPEQLMGDRELDGRSDTYSLGCVLFEMLTGRPPFSGKEGFVKRFTESPPRVSSLRKDAPEWIDRVLETALARNQSERFQAAQEFAKAIARGPFSAGDPAATPVQAASLARQQTPQPNKPESDATWFRGKPEIESAQPRQLQAPELAPHSVRRPSNRSRLAILAISAAVVLGLVLLAARAKSVFTFGDGNTPADSTQFALLPFVGTANTTVRDHLTSGLYTSLSDWNGLRLTSDQDVADAINRDGAPASTRAAGALARRLGAGRFLWGQVDGADPTRARAQLYDASSGAVLASVLFRIGGDERKSFASAARDLLKYPGRPVAADGGDERTQSYPAWRAYGRGHAALQAGNYTLAESAFADAVAADPDFGPAKIWLGQVRAWVSDASVEQWANDVTRGLQAKSGLSDKDRLVGLGLSSLAEKRFPQACATYSQMVAADSGDFVGLYGSGRCRALDSLVIRVPSSPSGWQFRSRYSQAARAFMQALSVNPSAHAIISFEQMQQLLPISSTRTRRGQSASGQEFAAFPGLIADSVVFIPYPLAEFGRLPAPQIAPQQSAALARNLDALLTFATTWTRDEPRSAPAYQALGEVLEARGEIARSVSGGLSAIQAIDRARQLAVTAHDRFAAGASAAWLLFKQGQFSRARILADSILSAPRDNPGEEAQTIIGLAALTGKLAKVAELVRMTTPYASSAFNLPVPVMDAAAPFFAFAALGVCGDTTRALERHLDEQIARYVAEEQQTRIRTAVKTRPLTMLAPCTAAKASLGIPAPASRVVQMQQALASGDLPALRSMLSSLSADTRAQRPGDISLDVAYQYAWLRGASGDTAGAIAQLDRTLGALPSIGAPSLREPASAAAAGRAMAFRAELAAARGDINEQRRWARAVTELWATADQPLHPIVARMRALAAQPR
jgi:serine/threonine protein kinase/tetratricopeptide (TPR) repeat protein